MNALSIQGGEKAVSRAIFAADTEAKAKARLEQLLDAEATVRVRDAAGEQITYERVPDNPIRLAAAVKILEWQLGKPRQSVEVTKGPSDRRRLTPADLAKMIRESPGVIDEFISGMKPAEVTDRQEIKANSNPSPSESESEGLSSSAPLSVQILSKAQADASDPAGPATTQPAAFDHPTHETPRGP